MTSFKKCKENFLENCFLVLILPKFIKYYKKCFFISIQQENYKKTIKRKSHGGRFVFLGQGIFSKNIPLGKTKGCNYLQPFQKKEFPNFYTSIFAYLAWLSINSRRGGTSSPINIAKIRSASAALSIVTCFRERVSGFIVVLHSCSAFISPKPL